MRKLFVIVAILMIIPFSSHALEIIKGPYLQNVTQDGITIMWETDKPSSSEVWYGEGELSRYKGDRNPVKIHEVRIEGLRIETRYRYKVISRAGGEEVESEVYSFRTAPYRDTPFRFAVWGDNRTDFRKCEEVAKLIASQNPDLVINVGDVVSNGEVYEQWGREYFIPIRHFAHSVPTYIAIGNHERQSHWFDEFVSQPGNEHWFAFTYGNSRFIILDTNRPYYPGSEQYEWLLRELTSREFREADFRFAFFHHPPYSEQWDSPGYVGEEGVRKYLVPLLEKYGVDIVFSGHTHDYERGRRILEGDREIYYIITGGGGSALDRVFTKDWDVIQKHISAYHCVVVDVKGNVLEFKAVGLDGKVLDSFRKVSLDGMARAIGRERPFLGEQLARVKGREFDGDSFVFALAGDTRSWLKVFQPRTWRRIIRELNVIKPAFVLDVGDLISTGYTSDMELLAREWREYFEAVSESEIPILPVVGNHDIWDETSQMVWRRVVGDLWYSFDYGNSHFIVLCSDQARPNHISRIGPEQLEWLKEDLEESWDAEHVFVFLHKPLWRDRRSNWDEVHELLKGYNVEAVIAGHAHIYSFDGERDGIKYIVSGGGGAEMDAFRDAGRFFHYMLVTVDGEEVSYSVVEPGSVHPIDVVTSKSASLAGRIARAISLSPIPVQSALSGARAVLSVSNVHDRPIDLLLRWEVPQGFRVDPLIARASLKPGEKREIAFEVKLDDPDATWGMTPRLTVEYPGEEGRVVRVDRYLTLIGRFAPKRLLVSYFDGRRRPVYPHITLASSDPKDFSLSGALLWDDNVLYVHLVFSDDQVQKGDRYAIELDVMGREVRFDVEPGRRAKVVPKVRGGGYIPDLAIRAGRSSVSIMLPWRSIDAEPIPGGGIKVGIEAIDSDGEGSVERFEWKGEAVISP